MKNYLIALLSFLIAPALAFAALDATLSSSAVIHTGGVDLVVSGSANIDSISVGDTSFDVAISPGASITVTSADRRAFTYSPSSVFVTAQTCDTTSSSMTITMASTYTGSATTVTVTPAAYTCSVVGISGGSVGGGGGGGGGGGVPTPVYTVIQGTAVSSTPLTSSGTLAQTPSTSSGQTKTTSTPAGLTVALTKTLKLGSQNSEVKTLQQALATDKTIYPEGKATGYYGPATKKAIQKFQKKYGIEQTGFVGPLTRKKIMEVYGTATVSSSAQTSSASTSSQTAQVSEPAKQQQIQAIQQLINQLLEQVKALQAKKAQ